MQNERNKGLAGDLKIGILEIVKEYSEISKKDSLLDVFELESKELRDEVFSKCDKEEIDLIVSSTNLLLKEAKIARNLLSIPKGTGHRCIFQTTRRDCPHYSSAKRRREEENEGEDEEDGGDEGDEEDEGDEGDESDEGDDKEWVACECRRIVICNACKPPDIDTDEEEDENVLDPDQQIARDYGVESCLCTSYYCGDCVGEKEHCRGDHGGYEPLLCPACCSSDCEALCDDCAHSEW
jgi:hypothetical protein